MNVLPVLFLNGLPLQIGNDLPLGVSTVLADRADRLKLAWVDALGGPV